MARKKQDPKQTFKDRLEILMKGEKPYTWARKAGIEKGLFQCYWQNGKIPTYENLLKIQRHTGCSLDWLLTGRVMDPELIENLPFETAADEDCANLRLVIQERVRELSTLGQKKSLFLLADMAKLLTGDQSASEEEAA